MVGVEAVGVREAVEDLAGVDLSVADHGEIARAGRAVARLQAFVDLAKVQINRRGQQLADAGDTGSAHALIDEARCTGNDAKATGGRDQVCATLPEFETALAEGAVTGAHLDALHQHTKVSPMLSVPTSPTHSSPTPSISRRACSTAT